MTGNKALLAVLLLLALTGASCAPTPPPGTGTPSFEARRDRALAAIAEQDVSARISGKFTYWVAQAKLAAGRTDDGMRVLEATLANRDGAMFRVWALADTYGRWRNVMTDQMKSSAEEQLVSYGGYGGGSTVNHRLMYATARYLASSYFPQREFRSAFSPGDATGREYLRDSMARFASQGVHEFDSPVYAALYLSVAQSLADLAPDADVKREARLALDSLLLSTAGEWLDGHWLSGSLRDKRSADGQYDFDGGDYILWLYTGGGATPDFSPSAIQGEGGLVHLVVHIIGNYISPLTALETIGRERTQRTYTHYDTDVWGTRRFYQTAFADRSYGVYSTYENYDIHTGYSSQYHRWGVRWLSPRDVSTFWLKHPHRESGTVGTTGYEKVLQCKGTVLGLYDVPATYPVQHIEGYVPEQPDAVIDESERGGLYLHYGSVLIGLRTTSAFAWDAGQTALRLTDPRAGYVVETARPNEYGGSPAQQLASFKQDVERNELVVPEASRLSYVTRGGTALSVTASGERRIDGQVIDLEQWPLVADPWVTQPLGSPTPGPAGSGGGACA